MFLVSGVAGLLGGGGAAAGAAATTAATATAGTGLSISSILQGLTTVGGLVASIAAGNAEAANYDMQAQDAEAEKSFETVQSADRQRSLLAEAADAVGQMDSAYAASGLDLSFGSAREARTRAYRQADLAQTTNSTTTSMRLDRLTQKAGFLRDMGRRAKSMGWINGLSGFFSNASSLMQQV